MHSDTRSLKATEGSPEDALLYTVFVALQDISSGMGPTVMYPGTHTPDFHQRYFGNKSTASKQLDCLGGQKKIHLTMKKGEAVIMDSRLLHCGGANTSKERRHLLCVSFLGPGPPPDGSTASLLTEYRNKFTLASFKSETMEATH